MESRGVSSSNINRLVAFAIPAGLIVGPLVLSLVLSFSAARHDLETRALLFADVVLDQAARTTRQLGSGLADLERQQPEDPCAPASVARMRQHALGSSLLQGFGYVEGNRLLCSSMADLGPVEIAPPDYASLLGYQLRVDGQLGFAPGARLLMITAPSGYTGFVHPDLIFALARGPDTGAFGLVSQHARVTMIRRGTLDYDWHELQLADGSTEGVLVSGSALVAWRRVPGVSFLSYAALPLAAVDAAFIETLGVSVGVSLLVSVLLFWLRHRLRRSRGSLPNLLRAGLRRREIFMVYQPIVDLRSGACIGMEALARWQPANGDAIAPSIFVPIAEKHGLIGALTAYVMAEGIAGAAPLLAAHPELFLSLNVSSADLDRPELCDDLESAVRRHGLAPGRIHIEITERERVDPGDGAASIAALRSRGYVVGTDDFGVGYSNLHYLDALTLDFLKIDRSLLFNAFCPGGRPDLVDHIIDLARTRQIDVIAEGVECEDQREALLARGVAKAQGWLFHRAMTAAALKTLLAAPLPAAAMTTPG